MMNKNIDGLTSYRRIVGHYDVMEIRREKCKLYYNIQKTVVTKLPASCR